MYNALNGPVLRGDSNTRSSKYKIVAGMYSEYRRLSLDTMHRVVRTVLMNAVKGQTDHGFNR